MTERTIPAALVTRRRLRSLAIVAALVAVVGVRWAIVVGAGAPALATGVGFGALLLAIAVTGGAPIRLSATAMAALGSVGLGMLGGLILVSLALTATLVTGSVPPFAPASAFLPWAGVTVLVAFAEELVLRGALFESLTEEFGDIAAVAVTSAIFALIHVPLYGWHVVPLDVGVGLWLGGLRLVSGGVAAPAIAHAVADLATWWL